MKQHHLGRRLQVLPALSRALWAHFAIGASLLCACSASLGATGVAITGKPPGSVTTGSSYTFTPTVSDSAAGRTFKFTIANQPGWAGFNSATGTLFGYPQAAGTYSNIVISVSDGSSTAKLPAFTVTVTGTNPVKISGAPAGSVTAGAHYDFKPTGSDAAGRALTYSVVNKPTWATFSIATGELSGTPTSAQAGTYSGIVIYASDGAARALLPGFAIQVATAGGTTTTTGTLAQKHPGDVGMGSDPAVVLYEDFSESSVAAIAARYDSYKNTAGMALVADHPVNSPSPHALQLTAGGSTPETNIYKDFGAGYDELWIRYYVKYEGQGPWDHSGMWFGGANPTLPYPYPHAGQKPVGNDRFIISLEPTPTFANTPMEFYNYWMDMHSYAAHPTANQYYGNTLLHDAQLLTQSNEWMCYEIHMKLNTDTANDTGAILELWQNDALVRTFNDTGPYGYWVGDRFCPADADGTECTKYRPSNPNQALLNQRYRSVSQLKINYLWPEHYNTGATKSSLMFDDMVVAKQRVGCTVKK